MKPVYSIYFKLFHSLFRILLRYLARYDIPNPIAQKSFANMRIKTRPNSRFCVAPMMTWTDKHCRYLHRLYSPNALLFTEMVTTGAILHGQDDRLAFNMEEHSVVLQLGGNDPGELSKCCAIAEDYGYDEINLNIGCPSDRVQSGCFGASLMLQPELVADCVKAMSEVTNLLISIKCRIGVETNTWENRYTEERFQDFISLIYQAGCDRVYLHARKAILGGLTPAQNRAIPPLNYTIGSKIKGLFPDLELIINGGIKSLETTKSVLDWADGVMLGRAAYHHPRILSEIDKEFCGTTINDERSIVSDYARYAEDQVRNGTKLRDLTRPLLHAFHGKKGARKFRQILSDNVALSNNDFALISKAIEQIEV